MPDRPDRKRAAADSFDAHAAAYVDSRVHREGDDLERLADWCADAERALDVATGAGHTAGAIQSRGVPSVVAADAAPSMVATAVASFPGLHGVVADAERLPFADDRFDAVACRIAAHHFPDPEAFVAEVARVLRPGGTFALEDNVAPDDPDLAAFLNDVEGRRDPTHVASHRVSTWHDWLRSAGFTVEATVRLAKPLDYAAWLDALDVPAEARGRLAERFADPPDGAAERFEIERDASGDVVSFANLKALVRATR